MGITILRFDTSASSEYLTDNEFILFLQIIGFAISFAFIVMILILDKHGKQYLKKMSFLPAYGLHPVWLLQISINPLLN